MGNIWVIFLLVSVGCSAVAQILMKMGMNDIRTIDIPSLSGYLIHVAKSPFIVAGFALYGIGAVLWLSVLSRIPLSAAYPMVSLGFVIVAVLSWMLLGEALSPGRIAGIVLIMGGVLLVGLST